MFDTGSLPPACTRHEFPPRTRACFHGSTVCLSEVRARKFAQRALVQARCCLGGLKQGGLSRPLAGGRAVDQAAFGQSARCTGVVGGSQEGLGQGGGQEAPGVVGGGRESLGQQGGGQDRWQCVRSLPARGRAYWSCVVMRVYVGSSSFSTLLSESHHPSTDVGEGESPNPG